MKKRIIIISIILTVLLIGVSMYFIYGTFAIDTSNGEEVYYFDLSNDNTTVTVSANSHKTVVYKIKNTNNGTVRYGIGYTNNGNIEVLATNDSPNEMTGTIKKNEYKFIKLRIINKTTSTQSTTLSTILGYENGGDLIVPSDKEIVSGEYTPPPKLTTYITNLYTNATKIEVTNNSITYNYANIYDTDSDSDSSGGLMNDRLGGTTTSLDGGNIRYYGKRPNNYIYFNCTDYTNQSADTCEVWQIIGVFGDKVKIIKYTPIEKLAWDFDKNIDSSLTTFWDNNWETSSLQVLLNTKYYEGKEKVTYYSNYDGYPGTTLDMASIGLKNDATRNKIAKVTWNLGGWNTSNVYSNEIYGYERGTKVYSGRPTTWTGKIGLLYPSDYGYGADFTKCTQTLTNYDNSACESNLWLDNLNIYQWFLTPHTDDYRSVWYVKSLNSSYVAAINSSNVQEAHETRPVLYLSSEEVVEAGDGSYSNPYQLGA